MQEVETTIVDGTRGGLEDFWCMHERETDSLLFWNQRKSWRVSIGEIRYYFRGQRPEGLAPLRTWQSPTQQNPTAVTSSCPLLAGAPGKGDCVCYCDQ